MSTAWDPYVYSTWDILQWFNTFIKEFVIMKLAGVHEVSEPTSLAAQVA
jgi:hypothetical protein